MEIVEAGGYFNAVEQGFFEISDTMNWYTIYAPLVAKYAKLGQFIIFRVDEFGERVPITMADHDSEKGTVDIIVAVDRKSVV